MTFSTADLFDANPDTVSVWELQFRRFGRKRCFSGRCIPLRVNEDHRPVRELVSTPGNDSVLVVDGAGSLVVGLMGDRLAELAVKNGWVGAIIHRVIRDSAAIDRLDSGVKTLGNTARRSEVQHGGVQDVTVEFGDVRFAPGDWVYADDDPVIVSPRQLEIPDRATVFAE